MSTPAAKTTIKSPTSNKDSPSFKSPPSIDIVDLNKDNLTASDEKLKKVLEDLKETEEKHKDETILSFTSFFENLTDEGHIRTQEAFMQHLQKQRPITTPKQNLEKHFNPPDSPKGHILFPTDAKDIPPEVKSDSKPATINTGATKNITASTGTGNSNPPKETSTSGSNGPKQNRGQPNPPSGGY